MQKWLLVLLVIVGVNIYLKVSKNDVKEYYLDKNATILAFGDSLTYGFGSNKSYPDFFREMTGMEIINAGVNGEVSSEGVERLKDYLVYEPDLVILCHGGNDILQKKSREELKNNLITMIKDIKASGAKILLVGVPEFDILGFDTIELYYDVADEEGVILEDEVIGYIVARNNLKSDYVHPNEDGYKLMAESFIKLLKEKYFFK